MGTRNLTIVKSKGKTKIAQYGQWDGYPTGQGDTIAVFLRTADLKAFQEKVDKLGEWTPEAMEKLYTDAGHYGSEWVSGEISNKVHAIAPELNRDQGAGILDMVMKGTSKVRLAEEFKNDKLFCEYCYEIDLDKHTVTMNDKEYSFELWTMVDFMKKLEEQENEEA